MIKGSFVDKMHKSIILYLLDNPKSTYTTIARGVGCSHTWAKKKVEELVQLGILNEDNSAYPSVYSVNKDTVRVRYSTQEFTGQLVLLSISLFVSLAVSLILFNYMFFLGSLLPILSLYIYFSKRILLEPEHKMVEIEIDSAKNI